MILKKIFKSLDWTSNVRCSLFVVLLTTGYCLLPTVCHALLTPAINKFNAGEITPLLLARNDFVKYQNSCNQLQNMIVLSQGPARRRSGTKFIATTKDNAVARLIPFEFSKTDTYMLEFTNLLMRAYRNGGLIRLI